MSEWQPIETAPDDAQVFVAAAFGVDPMRLGASGRYNSDPYCVWRDTSGNFARWPHKFAPTHWMPLPEPPKGDSDE